ARAGEPRSTPERACFTTCSDATLGCGAGEVTFYLAVPSPSSSCVSLPVRSSARHRSSSGSVLSPPPPRLELAVGLDEPLEHLHDEWPHLDRLAARLAVVARVGGQRRVKLAGDSSLERCV